MSKKIKLVLLLTLIFLFTAVVAAQAGQIQWGSVQHGIYSPYLDYSTKSEQGFNLSSCSMTTDPANRDFILYTGLDMEKIKGVIYLGGELLTASDEEPGSFIGDSEYLNVGKTYMIGCHDESYAKIMITKERTDRVEFDYVLQQGSAPTNVLVTGISVVPQYLALNVGDTPKTLNVTISPANATNKAMDYTISDPSVISMNSSYEVTPLSEGTATITLKAKDGSNCSATVTVTVSKSSSINVPVTGISVDPQNLTLKVGDTPKTLNVIVSPGNATNKAIDYNISDPSVISMNSSYVVTPLAAGTATITFTPKDGSDCSASVTVTVTKIDGSLVSIVISPSVLSLNIGVVSQLTLNGKYSNNTVVPISGASWTSANNKIAKVDNAGNVTAIGKGTTVISAKYNGKTATCAVTVKNAIDSLTADTDNVTLKIGESKDITLTALVSGTPDDVTDKADWVSDNSGIASVSDGTITGISVGDANITASYGGKKVIINVSVVDSIGGITLIATPENVSLQMGAKPLQLKVQARDEDGKINDVTKECTYTIDDEDVAKIDNKGKVTAVGKGNTFITASYNGVDLDIDVVVTAGAITKITVTPTKATLVTGGTADITVTGYYANKETEDITNSDDTLYTSSNENVCYVENGQIIAEGKGTATITVKVGKLKKTISVKVTK